MIDDEHKPALPELILPAATRVCPNCGKPAQPAFKPFCSKRCADVDLARWLKGSYAVPASPDEDDEAERVSSDDREQQ